MKKKFEVTITKEIELDVLDELLTQESLEFFHKHFQIWVRTY